MAGLGDPPGPHVLNVALGRDEAKEPAERVGRGRVGGRRLGRAASPTGLVSPAATSNRACGSLAHGSQTFFTVGIQRP